MLRLALVVALFSSLALAQDAGGSSTDAGGVSPLPPSGHPPPKGEGVPPVASDAGHPSDAGVPRSFPKLPPGGSHCKMLRSSDNVVLAEINSSGTIMDCQREVRTEARNKHCKESHQRIDVSFIGDWNGIAIEPVAMHLNCPKK